MSKIQEMFAKKDELGISVESYKKDRREKYEEADRKILLIKALMKKGLSQEEAFNKIMGR